MTLIKLKRIIPGMRKIIMLLASQYSSIKNVSIIIEEDNIKSNPVKREKYKIKFKLLLVRLSCFSSVDVIYGTRIADNEEAASVNNSVNAKAIE